MNDIAVVSGEAAVKALDDRANRTDRFGPRSLNLVKAWFGAPSQRRLAHGALQVDQIRHWESQFLKLTDQEILQRGQQLRGRARGGEALDAILPEAFGLVCVAAQRTVKLRPFDVQLVAGVVLHRGALAEVATGEGKTLVATLPAALNALQGKGVHVTTVNDYLGLRDGEWTSAIYGALGLSVGVLQQKMSDEDRTAAYKADITYGTASEFGFDFLRDRLKVKANKGGGAVPFWTAWLASGPMTLPQDPKVQRAHHYALVDEADNIFIDEARTPLIISSPSRPATEEEQIVYKWADGIAKQMARDQHFYLDEKKHKIELTDLGRHVIRYAQPPHGPHSHAMDKLHEHIERALHANFRFRLDQHYMVDDGKIVIIDESTGRPMPDRHWREGLHQAVEAKEGQQITLASDHAAQITYQSYFRLYTKLAGMSGTAVQNFWELRRVYKLWVVCVPTNRPCIREHWPDRVFPTEDAKFDAVVEEVQRLRELGRPVLIGTRSVEKSEKLSQKLDAASVPHRVLNARPGNQAQEADIVAQAGRVNSVTIATNMAGRGTDILLGGNAETIAWSRVKDHYKHRHDVPADLWQRLIEEIELHENIREQRHMVLEAGGLHVLGTERHEARRIDRQLQGRAARQGDPGSAQFFMSLEDELLEGLGEVRQAHLQAVGKKGGKAGWQAYEAGFLRAQRRRERQHFRQRVDLMIYERQRQEILKDIGADPYVD
ncbi:MAG: preprotein translocase subunit SecA [Gemmataceae bacterium]|nr:preprotein translocase subunit SecA [Gemmataceae bacterium]